MRDVHNLAAKSKSNIKHDYQELVADMKKVEGSFHKCMHATICIDFVCM